MKGRPGDANISRVTVALPQSLQLDQSRINAPCTRVRFAAGACPEAAILGDAIARTPILDAPLSGPVYLVTSNHKLPDLVAALEGQVISTCMVGSIPRTIACARPSRPFQTFPSPASASIWTARGVA